MILLLRIGLLIAGILCVGGCAAQPKQLSSAEAMACRAQGGYEDRAPFGSPFCQFRYSDAGKSCSGKSDCQGRCLFYPDEQPNETKIGDRITGECEPERSTFGCYGTVDAGQLATGVLCTD